jgi:hypothetical protein
MEPVPVIGLAANFSPIPRIAPPPLGSEMEGAEIWKLFCRLDSAFEGCDGLEDDFELNGCFIEIPQQLY